MVGSEVFEMVVVDHDVTLHPKGVELGSEGVGHGVTAYGMSLGLEDDVKGGVAFFFGKGCVIAHGVLLF